MIFSRYVDVFKGKDDYTYIFSCLNRKWIKLSDELASIFYLHKDNPQELKNLHPEFFNALESEGFLVESPDEDIRRGVDYVSKEYNSTDIVEITINPTLDCNLRCWYCYESRHAKSVMSEEMIINVLKYIDTLLVNNMIKVLRLSFFGGEPLLYFKKVILPIILKVKEICDNTNTTLCISFTTNGVLINDKLLEDLQSITQNIHMQIAFDGNREIHNKVKFLTNGAGCYDRTIINVKKAIEKGFNIVVRCNYDKRTIGSFIDVIDDFKEYHSVPNLRFLFQRIWQEKGDGEMFELRKKLIKDIDSKYAIKSNLHDMLGNSLHRCYADRKNNIVINYDGLVFRCTARKFEKENSIGKISERGCELNDISDIEATINGMPYGLHCKKCRILPICPNCSQHKLEHGFSSCPINVTEKDMIINIRAAFHDLSGIKVDISR